MRKLSVELNFVDQPSQEQTETFYKVPDCYMLIYCPGPDLANQTVPTADCEAILDWIRHKHTKMKDWLVVIALEIANVSNDYD